MFFERADERKQGVKECGKEALHFFCIFLIFLLFCMYKHVFLKISSVSWQGVHANKKIHDV